MRSARCPHTAEGFGPEGALNLAVLRMPGPAPAAESTSRRFPGDVYFRTVARTRKKASSATAMTVPQAIQL